MKTYLFDFDGTLVDSMPVYISSMLRILEENNIQYSKDIVKTITPLGLEATAEYFITLGVEQPKDTILVALKSYMLEEYHYRVPAKKNVISVLQQLKKQGCSLNVLTASPHSTLDPCLNRLCIHDLFDHVWSCADFGTTKTDSHIYEKAAELIGEDVHNILFLDDNLNANLAAKAAGMLVCGVYDDSSKEYIEQIKASTDFYIYDFLELLDMKSL